MARSNGIAALALGAMTSCAGLESWSAFSGGATSHPDAGGSGSDAGAETDALATDGGGPLEGSVADAAIAFIQVNSVADENVHMTVAVPYAMRPQAAGDLNVVIAAWYDNATIATVTDSSHNPYRLAVGPTTVVGGGSPVVQSIYYASGIAAAAANANVVTVTWDKGTDSPDVRVLEYSGLDPKNPLDIAVGNSGNSLLTTSGPVTTHFAAALLVSGGSTNDQYSVAPADFVLRAITPEQNLAADRIVTAPGSYSADAPITASNAWVMQVAAFH